MRRCCALLRVRGYDIPEYRVYPMDAERHMRQMKRCQAGTDQAVKETSGGEQAYDLVPVQSFGNRFAGVAPRRHDPVDQTRPKVVTWEGKWER